MSKLVLLSRRGCSQDYEDQEGNPVSNLEALSKSLILGPHKLNATPKSHLYRVAAKLESWGLKYIKGVELFPVEEKSKIRRGFTRARLYRNKIEVVNLWEDAGVLYRGDYDVVDVEPFEGKEFENLFIVYPDLSAEEVYDSLVLEQARKLDLAGKIGYTLKLEYRIPGEPAHEVERVTFYKILKGC